jgi:myo-inositol-1(or 4)-monophosphatase
LPAPDPDPTADLTPDLALLEEAVREAGHIARRFFGGPYKRWTKAKGSPVTEADLAIDAFLTERLRSARPDYGWLSEETEDDESRLKSAFTFVVDPIDGTIAFVRAKPHFTICAGIVAEGRPIAGVVYNPISDECFRAARGLGASCNGQAIRAGDRSDVEGCRMLGDKPMFEHAAWSSAPNIPWPAMEIETRNSIALRMALVARGEFDAMMALSPKHDWDLAAAEIILLEAGAAATTHRGDVLRYNGATPIQSSIVAAGPALHEKLLARVRHLKLSG